MELIRWLTVTRWKMLLSLKNLKRSFFHHDNHWNGFTHKQNAFFQINLHGWQIFVSIYSTSVQVNLNPAKSCFFRYSVNFYTLIKVFIWPCMSMDLKPLKHLWNILKHNVDIQKDLVGDGEKHFSYCLCKSNKVTVIKTTSSNKK